MQALSPGTYTLRATHLGASFDLVKAARETVGTLAPGKSHLFIRRTDALYFLFPFGSVVSVGLTATAGEPDIAEFRPLVHESHDPVRDEYVIRVAPEEKEEVEFEQATVHDGALERLALVAALLAQSNTLEHYERVVASITANTAEVTDRLAQGKMPPSGSPMLVFIGQSLGIRRELVTQLSVLDPPEAIWEDDSLDRLYHGLQANFEIPQRMRVVEHKLELIHDTAQMVVSINEGRRSHVLELIIILLIAFDIVMAMLKSVL